jgi:hypothetical protein
VTREPAILQEEEEKEKEKKIKVTKRQHSKYVGKKIIMP